jgi:hypothetical protein
VHLLDELVVGQRVEVDVLVVVGHRSWLRKCREEAHRFGGSTSWNRAV